MVEIGRVLTAMATPFDEQGAVDYDQACRLANALLNSGSDGLVISGTTGESPTLSTAEKLRLFHEIKQAIGNRGALVAGTGNYSTAESIELTHEAAQAGADAALLVVPYYNKPTQEGLYRHFRAIAESTSLPCILYNVPSRTAQNLAAETVIRLSEIENIVGVKEAGSNLDQAAQIISGSRPGFRVWSGNDNETILFLAIGGYGVVSVASHLVGRQIQELIGRFGRGEVAGAAELHRRLLPLFKVLFVVSNPSPLKYALNRVGFRVGQPRLPLVEPDEKSKAAIDAVLQQTTVDLLVAQS